MLATCGIHDGTGTLRTVVESAVEDGTIHGDMRLDEQIAEIKAIWEQATADAAAEQAEFSRLPGQS